MKPASSTRFRALLVEDDPLLIEMARTGAAESSLKVDLTVLEGVDAALDWIRNNAAAMEQMPHLVIIDLKLPKLDGLGVLRTMRNQSAMHDIPMVVFSAEHTQPDVLLSYHVGANTFVATPADPAQFAELFRDQLAYWVSARQSKAPAAAKGGAARA